MDRLVPIDMDLIAKITGFPTSGVKPEDYLDNKSKIKKLQRK
jgi:hypothetical protein